MAEYYDNSDTAQRFQPGTTVRADEVDAKFDSVATGFSVVAGEVDRSLKLVADGSDHEVSATANQRRNKVIGFDRNGDMTLTDGFDFRGDFSSSTTYFVNDLIRDTATRNLYVVNERHVSSTSLDMSKVSIAVNVSDVEAARDLAEAWANKTSGTVDGSQYSAKYWATYPDVITLASDIQGDDNIGAIAANINDVQAIGGDLLSPNFTADQSYDLGSIADVSDGTDGTPDGYLITAVDNLTTYETANANYAKIEIAADNITDIITVADDITFIAASPQAATDAANARDAAEDSKDAAQVAESNALSYKNSASQSATSASDSLDAFTDVYLGSKTTNPATDNDGDPLQTGALYYNTDVGALRIWTGIDWIDVTASGSGMVGANNLADVASASSSRTNLGLGNVATQTSSAVNFTGGSITNTDIDFGAV